jgi:hypothetical protein
MIKKYRNIGTTTASYISGLSSGQSQAIVTFNQIIKDSLKFEFKNKFKLTEQINIKIDDGVRNG